MAHEEIQLRRIRNELKASQETVARRTSLTTGTYRRAEEGFPVKYSTAIKILEAINSLLRENNRREVSLQEIGLNLM